MPRTSGSRPHQRPAGPGREHYSSRRGNAGNRPGRSPGHVGAPGRNGCRAARERLAYESARIIAEQGIADLERARRKAAERIGVSDKRCWPDNSEIEQALQQQNRLFYAERQQQTLAKLRSGALAAMRAFSLFDPRLVGQTVTGTATREQGVQLYLFADDPAEIVLSLIDRGIPWQERDAQFRYAGGPPQVHPVLAFVAGDVPVELIVLPHRAKRNPPLSPVTERPERGLSAREVEDLISAADEDSPPDGL